MSHSHPFLSFWFPFTMSFLQSLILILTPSSPFPQVQITLSTHDCGGLSQRDITLATFVDQASVL